MAATVQVNGRTVVHADSEGVSTAFPDWCRMPNGTVVPFFNTAYSKDITGCARTVFADGYPVANLGSWIDKSTGNESSLGGVISGKVCGKASFFTHSLDVFIEGQPAVRNYDLMLHNHGSPPNAVSEGIVQPDVDVQEEKTVICRVICFCENKGRDDCMNLSFAEERLVGGKQYWDPRNSKYYVQVPFVMTAEGWAPVLSTSQKSKTPPHLPLPAWWAITGSRRPDITIVKNPLLPLTRANVKRIVEIKFPGDTWGDGQYEDYAKIDPTKDPLELNVEKCGCQDGETVYDKVPVNAKDLDKDLLRFAALFGLTVLAGIIALDPEPASKPALIPVIKMMGQLMGAGG